MSQVHLPLISRPRLWLRAFAGLAVSMALLVGLTTSAPWKAAEATAVKPTIVLVHGAWADASSWNPVSANLQRRGYTVIAPANPLRGLASDADYLSSVLDTIEGPIVLVGHSYGGMVVTGAANGHPNVDALVYIAAFAPDIGETLGGLGAMNPGSLLTPENLVVRPHPGGADGYIAPNVFGQVFAGDLPRAVAALMAASQRPIDLGILSEPAADVPAWRTIPSWYMVATEDKAIPPATERFMAQRAGAVTVEVQSSHVPMLSRPLRVVDLILDAVHTVR
jgi:pimeloyl-ACP methyl ester carboxylesterase